MEASKREVSKNTEYVTKYAKKLQEHEEEDKEAEAARVKMVREKKKMREREAEVARGHKALLN